MARRKKQPGQVSDWDIDWQDSEPTQFNVEVNRATADKGYGWKLAVLIGWHAVAVIAIFTLVAQGLGALTKPPDTDDWAIDAERVASAKLDHWLTSNPVPGATRVTDGVVRTPDYTPSDSDRFLLRTVDYTISDRSGHLFAVSVPVDVDVRGGGVAGDPALMPLPDVQDDAWQPSAGWPGVSSTAVSDDAHRVIESWLTAFSSGDATALRMATGDADVNHIYQPLPAGSTVGKPEIIAAGTPNLDDPSVIAVRIKVLIDWPAGAIPDATGTPTSTAPVATPTAPATPGPLDPTPVATPAPTATPTQAGPSATVIYDLRLIRADTGSPAVTAWGAPGDGPSLADFINATIVES